MLLFRSDEHVERWRDERRLERGASLTPHQLWRLADAWYRDRRSPEWRRRTPEEAEAVFEEIGLTGPFWQLRP